MNKRKAIYINVAIWLLFLLVVTASVFAEGKVQILLIVYSIISSMVGLVITFITCLEWENLYEDRSRRK